jgi:2-oxoglutarate ferredoxin oxidoreductase subunit alpha
MAGKWKPYMRDPEKLSRYWAVPGMQGFAHRIGGLEKDYITGEVSHDPLNHQKMTDVRQAKIDKIADYIPELEMIGKEDADLLVIGWGGTFGHLYTAYDELKHEGYNIALAHFNYINPLPRNTYDVLSKFDKKVVCELNMGQFAGYLRMKFEGLSFSQFNKVQGLPFTVKELK